MQSWLQAFEKRAWIMMRVRQSKWSVVSTLPTTNANNDVNITNYECY